jgi:transaldolase
MFCLKLYIDDADVKSIESIFDLGIFSGITTNPTILSRNGTEPLELVKVLLKKFDGDLFVQCTSQHLSMMIEEGEKLHALDPERVILKVPFCEMGIAATKNFVAKGIRVALTGIHTFSQVVISSIIGADYVAPYVNRMENAGIDIKTVLKMEEFLEKERSKTQIIAASFKNLKQFEEIASYNVSSITAPVSLYKTLFKNSLTEKAIVDFNKDWEQINKTHWVI